MLILFFYPVFSSNRTILSAAPAYSYEIKQGLKWLKVFHQKVPNFFSDLKEAELSLVENKFSILSLINEKYRIYDRYEFLLEYPGLGWNRWLQSNSPLSESNIKNGKAAEGFETVYLKWEHETDYTNEPFLGLGYSNAQGSTLIDGTGLTWYFAIGQVNSQWGGGTIAGPFPVNEVYLWMRVRDTEEDIKLSYFSNKFIGLFLLNNDI